MRGLGNAEVSNLNLAVLLEHDILRLYVAVYNSLAVGMLERAENLHRIDARLLPRKHSFFVEILLKCNAVKEFHNDILHIRVYRNVVYAYEILMRQHCHRFGLVDKTVLRLFIPVIFVIQDFYGNRSVHEQILCLQHERHSSDAHEFKNFVSAVEHLPDEALVFIVHGSLLLSDKNGCNVIVSALFVGNLYQHFNLFFGSYRLPP